MFKGTHMGLDKQTKPVVARGIIRRNCAIVEFNQEEHDTKEFTSLHGWMDGWMDGYIS